jgi:uncharacterized repeat protein (TIGR03803 family)
MRKNTLCFALVLAVLALASISRAGTPVVLYNFCSQQPNCADGANPMADLVMDPSLNLWGTTTNGGAHGFGTIFELTMSSGYTVQGQVYSFKGGAGDGAYPEAGLVLDSQNEVFYGTTSAGGTGSCANGCGTIFAFHPGSSTDTILHFFGGNGDGATPKAELIIDPSQNLYGTTSAGGSTNCNGGCGTVFITNPVSNTYQVLHRFTGSADGDHPVAGLATDSNGNLWGTAKQGGADGFGTVFELAAPAFTNLAFVHSFKGPPNGAYPATALTFDGTIGGTLGTLYGTTSAGGNAACSGGCGLIFQLEISGLVFKNIYKFTGAGSSKSGAAPLGRLWLNVSNDTHNGHLYGTASMGGTDTGACPATGCGTAIEVCPPTRTCTFRESTLLDFDGIDGQNPSAGLLIPASGGDAQFLGDPDDDGRQGPLTGKGACTTNCIGTGTNGGVNGKGVVIGIKP